MCFESNLIPKLILALEGMINMLPRLLILQFLPQLQEDVLFTHPTFLTLRFSIRKMTQKRHLRKVFTAF